MNTTSVARTIADPARKTHIKTSDRIASGSPPHESIGAVLRRMFADRTSPTLVAVGGPGGIGKSTFALRLAEALGEAVVLGLDDYKTSRSERALKKLFGPHPEANRLDMLREHLAALRDGRAIEKPCYCRRQGTADETVPFQPARFVIGEGEVATYRELHDLFDFSVFIDAHWRTQLNTRLGRDIEERGYTPRKAIETFLHSNLLEFETYGAASKSWADVHLHCDADYRLVLDAMCSKVAPFWTAS